MSLATFADLAQLLAEVFLEPDTDLGPDLEAALGSGDGLPPALQAPLAQMVAAPLNDQDRPVEYTRLFLQALEGDPVHLFASVQARGHHQAPDILGPLKAIHDEADLSLQDDLGVPPDHLGLELACLSAILGQSLDASDPVEEERLQALALRLLREHLHPLSAAVSRQLPSAAPAPYFQAGADRVAALLDELERELAVI